MDMDAASASPRKRSPLEALLRSLPTGTRLFPKPANRPSLRHALSHPHAPEKLHWLETKMEDPSVVGRSPRHLYR